MQRTNSSYNLSHRPEAFSAQFTAAICQMIEEEKFEIQADLIGNSEVIFQTEDQLQAFKTKMRSLLPILHVMEESINPLAVRVTLADFRAILFNVVDSVLSDFDDKLFYDPGMFRLHNPNPL